jgi:hypothetical protein
MRLIAAAPVVANITIAGMAAIVGVGPRKRVVTVVGGGRKKPLPVRGGFRTIPTRGG